MRRYLVYDTVLQTVFDLTFPGDQLSNVKWSPRTDRNIVAYVRSNNIYLREIIRGGTLPEYPITSDGSFNQIINGVLSWVYEEEVFGDYSALWWSNSGTKLAYLKYKYFSLNNLNLTSHNLRTNESAVPEYSFPMYNGGAYTDEVRIKYPKVHFFHYLLFPFLIFFTKGWISKSHRFNVGL